jgi:energy-converting hydrogenase Eha subunit A
MRIFTSALGGSIASLLVFSALWSTFVVQHHDYGGDSRASQIFGTVVFLGYAIFPLILVPVIIAVLILEFAVIAKRKTERPAVWRSFTWVVVCTLSISVLIGVVVPEHAGSAALCGLFAAVVGALAYERLAAVFPRMKEANQTPEPTAPSGRGSS